MKRDRHMNPKWWHIGVILGIVLFSLPPRNACAQSNNLREKAFAALWSEHADRAVRLFQSWQAANPGQQDPATLRGLALALSWNGQQTAAEKIYLRLSDLDHTDSEALIGLARARIWDNRLAQGWHTLRAVETNRGLTSHGRREASDFALKVLDEYTPTSETSWRGTWDSDNLNIHRFTTLYATTFGRRFLVQTGPRASAYTQNMQPGVTALRWQLLVTTSLTHNLSFHGLGWFEHFGSGRPLDGTADKLNWDRPGGDAWLTWQATSRIRFDGGAASQPVDTYLGFARKIGYEQESLSCDWRPTPRVVLGASGIRSTYSDDNRKLLGRIMAGWHLEGPMEMDLNASYTHLDFTLPYPGGYWAPDWVRNGSLAAKAKIRSGRFTVTCDGSLGLEREAGSPTITVGGSSLRLGYRVANNWFLAVDTGHSRSSFSTASGYQRTFMGLTLKGNF